MHSLLINKLDLKLQCYGLAYAIRVMHIYLLREICQLIIMLVLVLLQIILVKSNKDCAPFTNCISKMNNTQKDNAEYIDIVMPMYNLIEYSDNY